MDNSPGNPPDSVPPPFGSSFNPQPNPVAPNNPYPPQPTPLQYNPTPQAPNIPENPDPLKHEHYSEVAQHKQRDEHGHFIHSDHPEALTSPTTTISQTSPNPSIPSNPTNPPKILSAVEGLPPIVEINQTGDPTYKKDPPAFGFFITNPVTYFKAFLNKLIKRQAITIKIPVLAILIIMVGIGGVGVGFQAGINWALFQVFPNYSPILHRGITEQGIIQKSNTGDIFLKADDKRSTVWTLKSVSANVKLEDYLNQHAQIRGNLDAIPNEIQVSEVISVEKP